MKIKRLIAAVLIVLCSLVAPVYADEDTTTKGIILIDPGHGGIDGGAKSKNGTVEKDINLAIGLEFQKRLEEEGYKVYMTRNEDKELFSSKKKDLGARCNMKRETNCDLFISIHQNKFIKEKCHGAQVWYSNNEKSEKLANCIQNALKEKVDEKNKRLPKPAKEQYKILRDKYEGASVIVECGFVSNNAEEKLLKTEEYQKKIVDGLLLGVNNYFTD